MKPNSKSYTGGTGPSTYVVTEWHAPRCLGGFVRSHYNGLGQLVMEQRPKQDWQYPFDGCGSSTVFNEVDTYYQYNSLGQQTRVSVPNPESSTSSANDTNIWWRRTASWSSGYSSATYDPIGRALSNVAPNGETTLHTYGAVGHATIQDSRDASPNNFDKVVRWEAVDLYGQMNETRSYYWGDVGGVWDWRLDSKVVLTHDGLGNLTKVVRTSPDNVTLSTMNYDKAGRKLSMQDADLGGTMNNVNTGWRYQYDRQNNLIRQTDAKNQTTCLYYEHALGRLAAKESISTSSCPALASFNASNRPVVTGVTFDLQYFYDQNHVAGSSASKGQLTQIDYTDNRWDKSIAYNSKGQVSKESVTIVGSSLLSTTYQYDSYLRPWKTTYPDGEVLTTGYNSMGLPMTLTSGSSVVLVDSASYDGAGRLTAMKFPAGGNLWRSQNYYAWTGATADSNGRLRAIKIGLSNGSSERMGLLYNYDSFGNIKTFSESYNGSAQAVNNFTYDAQNRLTNGYAKDYNYDAAGRMLKYEATSNNQTFNSNFPLHAIKNANYAYDLNGNMITRTVGSNLHSLTWDAENHLTSISGGGITTENYLYDDSGNRVKKSVGSTVTYSPFPTYEVSVTSGVSTVTKYYYFKGQRVAMKAGTVFTYLHGDHLGSTALATTSGGAWQSQEKYYAYGKDRDSANNVPTDHRFTGQKSDGSGLMYYNSRFYDPQIGLFVSPDTIVPDAGLASDYNRFAYARGNSLKYNDPSGHCFDGVTTIACIAIAAIAAGSALIVSADTANHHEPTQEEINSSRLGGGLILAGAGGLVLAEACATMPEKCGKVLETGEKASHVGQEAVEAIGPSSPGNHFALGVRDQPLEQLADKIGAKTFLNDGEKWRDNFLTALADSTTKFSVNLDGFDGYSPFQQIQLAVQKGLGKGMLGRATEWEMAQLYISDRLKDVDFYLNGQLIENPYQ